MFLLPQELNYTPLNFNTAVICQSQAPKKTENTVPGSIWSREQSTPALATSQPQCEFTETIPTSPIIIHTADVGFICPGKYRWRIFAQ